MEFEWCPKAQFMVHEFQIQMLKKILGLKGHAEAFKRPCMYFLIHVFCEQYYVVFRIEDGSWNPTHDHVRNVNVFMLKIGF